MTQYPTLPLTDPNVIALNQQGIITPEQQTILRFYVPWPFWGCLSWFILTPLLLVPFWWPGSDQLPSFMLPLYLFIFGGGVLFTTVIFGWYVWKNFWQRQEIKNGPVVWADGEVVAAGRRFEALLPRGRLKSPVYKIALIPGPYRFYYLPRSRFLLSAESLAPVNVAVSEDAAAIIAHPLTPDPSSALPTLMQTFRFNLDDLALNQTGYISIRQRFRLLLRMGSYLAFLLVVSLLAGLYAAARLLDWIPPEPPEITQSLLAQAWQILCLGSIALFAFGWPLWNITTRLLDFLRGRIQVVTGPIRYEVRSSGRSSTCYYIIQGKEFQVSPQAYYSFIEGLTYHIYYTPLAKEIVSIEPVGGSYT